jgi:uncharacterized repeat protein (TIGR02543 family)
MKKLFILIPLILLFGSFLTAQTTVGDALSVNFVSDPLTSSEGSRWNQNINAAETFGIDNYNGTDSTVLPANSWNNIDITNGNAASASVYYSLPSLTDNNGNVIDITGFMSGRSAGNAGNNWGTGYNNTAYFHTYNVYSNSNDYVPMVHLRDINSYAGTYDLIIYTHRKGQESVTGRVQIELDESRDNIDHNGNGTVGRIDVDEDGIIETGDGDDYGVQILNTDFLFGLITEEQYPVVFTNLSANNINISAYKGTGTFKIGGFQLIPTSAATITADPVLNVTAGVGGTTDQDGSNSYTSGSVVTITATPSEGYEFSGWSGDVSGSDNPLTVTVDSSTTITANFDALLTVDSSALVAVGWNTLDNALSSEDGETAGGGTNTANSVNLANDNSPDSFISGFSGVIGTSVTDDPNNGGGRVVFTAADNNDSASNGSYGTIEFSELVSSASGVKLDTFNNTNGQIDIKITNNSGSEVSVAGIHFDAKLNFGGQGSQISVSHLSGFSDLLDTNPSGAVFNSRNFSNKSIPAENTAWANYDISPGAMSDLTLANGESAAFRISVAKVNDVHSAVLFDNFGISILPITGKSLLTVGSSSGGSVDNSGSSFTTTGGSVTITATPDTGYEFTGWTGSDSSENPLTLSIDSNISITANFAASLTVDPSAVVAVGWNSLDNTLSSEDGETLNSTSVPPTTANSVNPANDTSPDTQIANFSGVLGTSVTDDSATGGGRVVYSAANNDGDDSYGSENYVGTNTTKSGLKLDTFNGPNSQMDIKMTNNSGSDVTLAGIHFDARLNFGESGVEINVSHLSNFSDLLDTNPNGSAFNSRNFSTFSIDGSTDGSTTTWANYDVSPAAMTDIILSDGESAAFRVSLNKVNDAQAAVLIDNMAISILPISGQSLLTVGSSSGGTVDNAGSSFKTTGDSVTITASPDTGYEFISWTGSDSIENPLTITVDDTSSIVANFQPLFDDNAVLIVGWNSFDSSVSAIVNEAPDTLANGFSGNLGSSVHSNADDTEALINQQGGGSATGDNANSIDTSYGRVYNISNSDLGINLNGIVLNTFAGNNKRYVDLSVTNNSSGDLALSGLHFDVGHLFFQADPDNPDGVLSDKGATITVVHLQAAEEASQSMPSQLEDTIAQRDIVSFNLPDGSLTMFSKSIGLGELADTTLGIGETAAFRIELENATSGSNNPHNVGITLDNIGISGTPAGDIFTLAVPLATTDEGNVDLRGSSKYVSGQVVNLSATPAAGYIFTGWSGDVTSTDASISVTMSSDLNISPEFALAEVPSLAISASAGSVIISWEGSPTLSLRSADNLTDDPVNVSGDIQSEGNTNTYTETIEGNQKFYRLILE